MPENDSIGKLLIALGYDTNQLDTGAKEAIAKTQKLNSQFSRQQDDVARQSEIQGAKAGKNFAKAYGKEMMFVRTILRKFFGETGDLIGEGLGLFSKFGKTKFAQSMLPQVGGTAAGQIAGQSAGTVVAGAAGAGAAIGGAASAGFKSAISYLGGLISREGLKDLPDGGKAWMKQGSLAIEREWAKTRPNIAEHLVTGRWGRTRLEGAKFAIQDFLQPSAMVQGGPGAGMGQLAPILGRGGMSFGAGGALGKLAGGIGAIGTGAIAGAAAAVTGLMVLIGGLASKYDGLKKKQKEFWDASAIIKEIESIKDPIDRHKAILEKFGKDGQKVFRELKDSTADLKKEIGSKDWNHAVTAAYSAWEGMKSVYSGVWTSIKETTSSSVSWIMGKITGIGKGFTDDMLEVQMLIDETQRKLDRKLTKRLEQEEAGKKLVKEQLDLMESIKETTKAQMELDSTTGNIGAKVNYINKEIERLSALQTMVTDSEQEYWDYERQILSLKKESIDVSKEIASEDEKRAANLEKLVSQYQKQKEIADKISSLGISENDKRKWTVDRLISNTGEWLQQPTTRQGKWNMMAAWEIKNAEGWASRYELEGRSDLAKKAEDWARKVRRASGALTSEERDPTRKSMEEMAKLQDELVKLAKETGILVNPSNGK